ncbi:unnamed protein product [Peronospora destructor]|uniref:Uncharacterized protein n=1 Tax=Peronospora destructor TaxID=86335 RepID=A0AAV0V9Q1_9STRA|nr:unnamed protein product [Peronospora destructor]
MVSPGPKDVTMAGDMEEQYQKQQDCHEETMQTLEESVSVESTTTTVEKTSKVTTVEEHEISEVFVSTDSISAVAMEKTLAATLGSSVDGESVRTEDFTEEEAFIEEESSKHAEVKFAELAVADEAIEAKTQCISGKGTETTEELKQAHTIEKLKEMKEIVAETEVEEMDISVATALGSSVDVDNVLSLGDMCDSIEC